MNSWTDCPLIEVIDGKQGGVPVVKGTRIPAQQIVDEFRLGSSVTDIERNYPSLRRDQIDGLIAFDNKRKPQPVP
jgi:uncharacterized protein (DUF433 family)